MNLNTLILLLSTWRYAVKPNARKVWKNLDRRIAGLDITLDDGAVIKLKSKQ